MEINHRLKHAIASGLLPERGDVEKIAPVETIGDLLDETKLKTYGTQEDDVHEIQWNRPTFNSIPRKSSQPLISRRTKTIPTKGILKETFMAATAIWEFYGRKNLQNKAVLKRRMDRINFELFLAPLMDIVGMSYLGSIFDDIDEMLYTGNFYFNVPCVHGDEEGAGTFQAFLEGPESVAGQLMHYMDKHDLMLDEADVRLVKEHGLVKMTEFYAKAEGDKIVDLNKLKEYWNYFEPINKRFPKLAIDHFAIITYDCGASLSMFNADEIEAAILYNDGWEQLMDDMPPYYHMENNEERANETIIEDICKIWRNGHVSRSKV